MDKYYDKIGQDGIFLCEEIIWCPKQMYFLLFQFFKIKHLLLQ